MEIGRHHKSECLGKFDLKKALKESEGISHVNIREECSRSNTPGKGLTSRAGWYVRDQSCWNGLSKRPEVNVRRLDDDTGPSFRECAHGVMGGVQPRQKATSQGREILVLKRGLLLVSITATSTYFLK